jgi:hypothetical protein
MTEQSKSTISDKLKFLETFNIKYMRKNKKVFMPVIVIVSVFVVLLILEQLFGLLSISFFGNSMVKKNIEEIKVLQKQIQREQVEYRDILSRESQVIQQRYQYWVTSRDGNIDEKFRDKITSAAKNSNVDLSTTGTVKLSKVGDGITSGELEISCSGNMEGIVRFLYALTYSTPKMYWDRFSLRPDNYNNPNISVWRG